MESIIDEQGQIVRSSATLVALRDYIERDLGALVEAIACEEQVWRASGGTHMTGTWRATGTPVLIKLGIDMNQFYWTRQMVATAPDLVPTLYASGDQLGNHPINWIVMERIAVGSLGPEWQGHEFSMVLEAAVRFQQAARLIDPHHTRQMDASVLRRELEAGVIAVPPGPVDLVMERLERDWAWVSSVCELEVCHGDVHMTNALTRTQPPQQSDALLIDCQPIVQPWAFDAAYLQVLNSIDRDRVGYRQLVPKMARIRLKTGMSSCEKSDLTKVANLTLAWFAIRFWGLIPNRHTIADYRAETERYIRAGAAEGR